MMGNKWIKKVCLLVSTFLAVGSSHAVQPFNMTQGVTDISADVYSMHMIAFWLCVAIGVVVFSVMFYSIFAHRKSKGVQPATFHESTTAEAIWTFIPFVILIGLALPATKTLIACLLYTSDAADDA